MNSMMPEELLYVVAWLGIILCHVNILSMNISVDYESSDCEIINRQLSSVNTNVKERTSTDLQNSVEEMFYMFVRWIIQVCKFCG